MGCNGSKSASVVEPTGIIQKFTKKFTNKNDLNNEVLNVASGRESADEELNSISSMFFDDKNSNGDAASIYADDSNAK